MTQTLSLPTTADALLVLEGLARIAVTFGALPLAVLLLVLAYRWFVRRLDADVTVRAERAAARARVERRKNAQARNLELYLDGTLR
jgi:flagellar biogenesis protein FliO